MEALIFDCDGVIVDTEKDGHRVAFNEAFKHYKLDVEWSIDLYDELLKVAGGKERMKFYFEKYGWPESIENKEDFIKEIHLLKTDYFIKIIDQKKLPLRPGVKRIIDEAIANNMKLAVCSTSNEKAVNLVVERMLGNDRKSHFIGIFAGDVVSRKKPDPEIYNLAASKMKVDPSKCVVIEDSRNGLLAAKAAGMNCIVTKSTYTVNEDFSEADEIINNLDEGKGVFLIDLKKKYN